jgi:urease beta subunit
VIIEPGSEPWLGSVRPKQPIHSPVASLGRYFCFLRLGAELVDRHHHQRGLHAHHRAVAGIDALDFARDQAVGHVVQAGAAVLFGNGRAEQAQFAHLAEDGGVHLFVAEGFEDARRSLSWQ